MEETKHIEINNETKQTSKEYLEKKFIRNSNISEYYNSSSERFSYIELNNQWSDEDLIHLCSYFDLIYIEHSLNMHFNYTLLKEIKDNFIYKYYSCDNRYHKLRLDKETIINKWIPLFDKRIHKYLFKVYQ